MQEALQDSNLSLVHAGDTRWTSHYRAVKAVVKCHRSIICTLQHIHQDSGDLSSEAGGMLLTFQDRKSIILLFGVKEILDPLCKLSLKLQHQNGALSDIPDLLETVHSRLNEILVGKEYLSDAAEYIRECDFSLMDSSSMTDEEIHTKLLKPFITALSDNLKLRFNDSIIRMCKTTTIFESKNVTSDFTYGSTQITHLATLHSCLSLSDLQDEWKTFRNYLRVQAGKSDLERPCAKEILQRLAAQNVDLADTFPLLSTVARIILVCPLGTASVERSFSTMSRVCTRLRQRISPENLDHCLRVSIEGPCVLSSEQAALITYKWHSLHSSRRIQI